MERVGIGIIGCGNISEAYLKAASKFPILESKASRTSPEAARRAPHNSGSRPGSVDELLRDPTIEIIVNLTIPAAHVEVGLRALAAGKHVHSEKPLGITAAEARRCSRRPRQRGLRVGCAPDTFLGGAHQTCRKLVDEGAIGSRVAGTAFFMCPGPRALAPEPCLLLRRGRRADARHGALLHHRRWST